SPRPSKRRAALSTTVSARAAVAPASSTARTPLRIASPPQRAGMLHRDPGRKNEGAPDAGRPMALRRSGAAHVLVRLPLAGPRALPLGPRVLGGGHRRRP